MARTGLDTPPGMTFLAQSKSRMDESICMRRDTLRRRLIKLASQRVIRILYKSSYTEGPSSEWQVATIIIYEKYI
jgi:hypothetical protein